MSEKPPAGWYPDSTGTTRWWDGDNWTEHTPPPPPSQTAPTAASEPALATAESEASTQTQMPVRTRADAKAEKAYTKATRPWYKKKRFIIPIALVVLIVIGSAIGGGDTTDGPEKVEGSSTSGDGSSASEEEAEPDSGEAGSKSNPVKVGETVKLEGTQYTVESARTATKVGDPYFEERAGGRFVVVELTIENKKNETKTFSDEAAKFIATNGKSYSTDNDGTFAAIGDGDKTLIFEDMQPDVAETGLLVYDVPNGKAKGGLLEVSDLFGRGEAYIDLGL